MHKKSNKMKLSNPTVMVVAVLILLSSAVVIFFPVVSEQQQQQGEQHSVLKLAKSNASIDISLSKGYIDGNIAYFIATDSAGKMLYLQLQTILVF